MTIFFNITGNDYGPVVDSDLEEAFFWALKELMPRKKNLDVTLEIKPLEDAAGYHWMEYKGTHFIELDPNQTPNDFLCCLFHEMVHIRQAERGIYNDESIPYRERPVEIEAYSLQEELLSKWKSSQQSHSESQRTAI